MPDAGGSAAHKGIDGLLHAVAFPLDEIGADEETRSVESVVAVHANQAFLFMIAIVNVIMIMIAVIVGVIVGSLIRFVGRRRRGRGGEAQSIDQFDKILRFFRRRRNLGDGGEFMVLDASFIQAFGVIDGTFMADINDGLDPPLPIPHKDIRRMRIVDFP